MLDFETIDHEYFMREALKEAEFALQQNERPIGAVIVHHNQIVGRGRAQHKARKSKVAHAELNALQQAEQYIFEHKFEGCIVYSTVEPCVMCLGAIVMSNIRDLVFGLEDHWIQPSQLLKTDYIRNHIRHYVGGVLRAESLQLWQQFDPRELKMLLGEE